MVANRTADGHFGVVRLNLDGSVDTSFGSGGLTRKSIISAGMMIRRCCRDTGNRADHRHRHHQYRRRASLPRRRCSRTSGPRSQLRHRRYVHPPRRDITVASADRSGAGRSGAAGGAAHRRPVPARVRRPAGQWPTRSSAQPGESTHSPTSSSLRPAHRGGVRQPRDLRQPARRKRAAGRQSAASPSSSMTPAIASPSASRAAAFVRRCTMTPRSI